MREAVESSERFLSIREVRRRLGVGDSTLRRMVRRGEFPPPIRIGSRRVAWPASEFDRWIDERKAERVVDQ